ncbi:CLUMA_CG011254, isoform A [Clunio marinus]|uniref:CLUMA_CG011254, isoform A n=1 Tax=Clunio marinus TaxID=568069 RepID=A0A1J1IC63_9DIPT|nr:CLUMA_CG011254, isoform A [Clunio marinus]
MSRAFYVPPQSVNAVGNSEFLDILVTTFFALLERRHRCTRRCCGRSYLRSNYLTYRGRR